MLLHNLASFAFAFVQGRGVLLSANEPSSEVLRIEGHLSFDSMLFLCPMYRLRSSESGGTAGRFTASDSCTRVTGVLCRGLLRPSAALLPAFESTERSSRAYSLSVSIGVRQHWRAVIECVVFQVQGRRHVPRSVRPSPPPSQAVRGTVEGVYVAESVARASPLHQTREHRSLLTPCSVIRLQLLSESLLLAVQLRAVLLHLLTNATVTSTVRSRNVAQQQPFRSLCRV